MQIRILNAQTVRKLLPADQCLTLMRQAMRQVARDEALQPIRQVMPQPDGRGALGLMPGYLKSPQCLGIKVLTVFPGNFGTEFGSHQGLVLLFDSLNGAPQAILDAREITAIRTAAATAVATDVLARKDARTLAIFGYGEQARTHALALARVRSFAEYWITGRNAARASAFSHELSGEVVGTVRAVELADAAKADVICTVTAATEPFYRREWLRAGQHLNLVGASVPSACEIEPQALPGTRYFTDYPASARALAGEFLRARAAGIIGDEYLLGSVGDVLEGSVRGRITNSDITIFKSLGMIAEDLICANFVLAEAQRQQIGQLIDW